MGRVLRHGTRRNEHPLALDMEDGGSILVSAITECPTIKHLNSQRADVTRCTNATDRPNKLRVDLFQVPGGERGGAFQ